MTSPGPRGSAPSSHDNSERNHTSNSPGPTSRQNGRPDDTPRTNDETDHSNPRRKRVQERHQVRRREPTQPSVFSRRGRSRSPSNRTQDDNLSRRSRSPLRPRSLTPEAPKRKRPGGGSRMGMVNPEEMRRRQEDRERALEEDAMRSSRDRGVSDVVRQHYNAVPERGREWRKTESKIKGLRSFNNWVKSTLIQKFSPDEDFAARFNDTKDWADDGQRPPLLTISGCLSLTWDVARAVIWGSGSLRRSGWISTGRGQRGRGRPPPPLFHGEFYPKDCFGEWLGDVGIVQQVGIDSNAGPGGSLMASRWSGGGGFDVVTSMFAIHYAFESEEKTRQMLSNVAGCLKKGGRFIGVCPNSDVISSRVSTFHKNRKENESAKPAVTEEAPEDGEVQEDERCEWGNDIYRVRFPGATPEDGIFRPPFGWRYTYFMREAVEEVPEYVVPGKHSERELTEDYNLELQYRKPFLDIWEDEKNDRELGPLSERMGVRNRATGELNMTDEEKDAVSFYHAFCFYKV
ncbi:mRNA cap guanine-N7 methyltransferase [Penicillium manginii]|uniref:mRNA cap guanine-N7 methyltransferase n=1 Tax=Penicillium manginii TaxID=203109 RepID=UPI002546E9E3|nr:mRNA cap guanine-N7 methyltransferase [Penicillium manginii]KAJ5755768.1 mRNA cap guanine-N7 methyltransferase [Penicillium manginii]